MNGLKISDIRLCRRCRSKNAVCGGGTITSHSWRSYAGSDQCANKYLEEKRWTISRLRRERPPLHESRYIRCLLCRKGILLPRTMKAKFSLEKKSLFVELWIEIQLRYFFRKNFLPSPFTASPQSLAYGYKIHDWSFDRACIFEIEGYVLSFIHGGNSRLNPDCLL